MKNKPQLLRRALFFVDSYDDECSPLEYLGSFDQDSSL